MENIIKYFDGEKLQCIIGAVGSLIFLVASAYFLFTQKPLLKGMAYAIIPLSLFLLIICTAVIIRTPKDMERVTTFYESEPTRMQTEELPRMEKVMKSFSVIKKVELGVVVLGIVLAIFFWRNPLVRGIALALIVEGLLLYLFDYLAEARGEVYVAFLRSLPLG